MAQDGSGEEPKTRFVAKTIRLDQPELVFLTGDRKGESVTLGRPGTRWLIGADAEAELVIEGLAGRHAELEVLADRSGVRIQDLSDGDTALNEAVIHEGFLEPGGVMKLGEIELRLKDRADPISVMPSTKEGFGLARGRTLAMREVFGVLEVIAPTEATVLLLGETGTGKDVLARSIHSASKRKEETLLTLDCGAIAPSVIESELFGHERGAFTGAEEMREGAFERAQGGTLFLDEIGELPLDVQPKLLRAIDQRVVQRVGGNDSISVDVRIVAATKRDLEEEVRRGRFREDLFFRLAVVPLTLPPLRERREDIPVLVKTFVIAFAKRTGHTAEIDPHEIQSLLAHDWPGNVRELRNTVERALWMAQTGDGQVRFMLPTLGSLSSSEEDEQDELKFDENVSFSEHKQAWEAEFEKKYIAWLLARADGSLSAAARLAKMDRKHLRTVAKKHGLWRTDEDG